LAVLDADNASEAKLFGEQQGATLAAANIDESKFGWVD